MARHVVKPAAAPAWADLAYGLVFVPANSSHALSLWTPSLLSPYTVEDLILLTAGAAAAPGAGGVPVELEDALGVINANVSNGVDRADATYKILAALVGSPVEEA